MLAGWGPEQERKAKELLYRCMEELGSTKAALYLADTEGFFELAVSYGFGRRDPLLAQVKADHPLWDWIRRMRSNPTFINHPREAPQLHSFLEEAGTARLLTIPLLVTDRLVGFVDARDKGRRQPFVPEDIAFARNIAAGLVDFLYEIELYGSRPTEEKESPEPVAATPTLQAVGTRESNRPTLYRDVLEGTADLVATLATLPGLAAIALTATDGKAVRIHVHRGSSLDHTQREALALHQIRCLEGAGVRVPDPASWGWSEEESGRDATAEEIRSTILVSGPPCWVVLSCLTPAGTPLGETVLQIAAHQLSLLGQLRDYRRVARNLARTLLEPGESSFPHLRQHSQAVSELSQRMAAQLDLDERDEETLTIAAFLHDVGMRELEYQRIYRMERPGDVERRMYQRHPSLGARIVENSEYPGPLAGAILHHHERWDGKGYPQKLAGRTIPLFSRIIHLAEVYDVLTSSSSYRRPVIQDAALELIRTEAGKQFDPDLVPVLEQVVRG